MTNKYTIIAQSNNEVILELEDLRFLKVILPINADGSTLPIVDCWPIFQDNVDSFVRNSIPMQVAAAAKQVVVAAPDIAIQVKKTASEQRIRDYRARALYVTDWMATQDCQLLNKAAWITYRQALRDLTSQPGWFTNVVWPVPPAELKGPRGYTVIFADGNPNYFLS
jgi:hypothetical protein